MEGMADQQECLYEPYKTQCIQQYIAARSNYTSEVCKRIMLTDSKSQNNTDEEICMLHTNNSIQWVGWHTV